MVLDHPSSNYRYSCRLVVYESAEVPPHLSGVQVCAQ